MTAFHAKYLKTNPEPHLSEGKIAKSAREDIELDNPPIEILENNNPKVAYARRCEGEKMKKCLTRSVAPMIMAPPSLRRKESKGVAIMSVHHHDVGEVFPTFAIKERNLSEKCTIGRDSNSRNIIIINIAEL